ncbi:hypothetical protein Ocin01_16543 [Orchesella cincta]|uniref:Protein sel-1 1 n=1 Tax=Orchesella cincta TaxID=48709 RepID=A0A1D2MAX0_ORCCI|nr:hypothetical protein Ocin01_16543 [Orchesella cincta]
MARNTEDEFNDNKIKVDLMFVKIANYLREIFCRRYYKVKKSKWVRDAESGKSFSEELANPFFKKASQQHKDQILNGDIYKWDLDLLCEVLPLLWMTGPKQAKKKRENENDCIRKIQKLHQKINTCSGMLSTVQCNELGEELEGHLITLGMTSSSVKLMMTIFSSQPIKAETQMTLSSSRETEELAKEAYCKSNYEDAIVRYMEILKIFPLSSQESTDMLSKIASSYMNWYFEQSDPKIGRYYLDLALKNAEEALKENEMAAAAHHVAGICYTELENWETALKHLDEAASIHPIVPIFRGDRDMFRLIYGEYMQPDVFKCPKNNFLQLVAVVRGRVNQVYDTDVENLQAFQLNCQELTHHEEILVSGYQHLFGWGMEQDYKKASLCFEAACTGITALEARYAHDFIHQYANTGGYQTGVAEAQFFMGVFYENGSKFGIKVNPFMAAFWFKKSHQSGFAFATAKVGFLYRDGKGVPKSTKSAEMYWMDAVTAGHLPAYAYLMHLYISQKEYKTARAIADRALSTKDSTLVAVVQRLEKKITRGILILKKLEPEVKEFEDEHCFLSVQDLTFDERLKRKQQSKGIDKSLASVLLQDDLKIVVGSQNIRNTVPHVMDFDTIWNLDLKVAFGSVAAKLLADTFLNYFNYCVLLNNYRNDTMNIISEEPEAVKRFVSALYKVFERDSTSLVWDPNICCCTYDHLVRIKQFGIGQNDVAFCRKRDVCLAEITRYGREYLKLDENDKDKFLIQAWTLHSDSIRLASSFAYHFIKMGRFDQAYLVGKEALERFENLDMSQPDVLDLIYYHGLVCSCNNSGRVGSLSQMRKEAMLYFEKFIEEGPIDHRNTPEAYYNLGLVKYNYHNAKGASLEYCLSIVQHYLEEGRLAETNQLQCFLPYQSLARCKLELTWRSGEEKLLAIIKGVASVSVQVLQERENLMYTSNSGAHQLKTSTTRAHLIEMESLCPLEEAKKA